MAALLNEQSQYKEISNQKIYSEIRSLESKIGQLKHAHDLFVNRDNLDLPSSWQEILEKMIGKVRFTLIYFLGGLAGNLLSLAKEMFTGSYAVSAGASGAIFAVM